MKRSGMEFSTMPQAIPTRGCLVSREALPLTMCQRRASRSTSPDDLVLTLNHAQFTAEVDKSLDRKRNEHRAAFCPCRDVRSLSQKRFSINKVLRRRQSAGDPTAQQAGRMRVLILGRRQSAGDPTAQQAGRMRVLFWFHPVREEDPGHRGSVLVASHVD